MQKKKNDTTKDDPNERKFLRSSERTIRARPFTYDRIASYSNSNQSLSVILERIVNVYEACDDEFHFRSDELFTKAIRKIDTSFNSARLIEFLKFLLASDTDDEITFIRTERIKERRSEMDEVTFTFYINKPDKKRKFCLVIIRKERAYICIPCSKNSLFEYDGWIGWNDTYPDKVDDAEEIKLEKAEFSEAQINDIKSAIKKTLADISQEKKKST